MLTNGIFLTGDGVIVRAWSTKMQNETDLETARRQVRKGEDRIVRQEAIIDRLRRDGQPSLPAKSLLIALQEQMTVQLGRLQHLEKHEQLQA
jgi:hypothetical protein